MPKVWKSRWQSCRSDMTRRLDRADLLHPLTPVGVLWNECEGLSQKLLLVHCVVWQNLGASKTVLLMDTHPWILLQVICSLWNKTVATSSADYNTSSAICVFHEMEERKGYSYSSSGFMEFRRVGKMGLSDDIIIFCRTFWHLEASIFLFIFKFWNGYDIIVPYFEYTKDNMHWIRQCKSSTKLDS